MKPLLGILSVWGEGERTERPFGEQTALFEAISLAAIQHDWLACVIPVQELVAKQQRLIGYRFKNGTWVEIQVPVPHVVYNRIPTRAIEQTQTCKQLLAFLRKRTRGRLFNRSGFFSKLQIHTILESQMPAGLFLPKTDLAITSEQVLRQAAIWGELWLKPTDGSLGRQVYRILREPFGFSIESSDLASSEQLETPEAVAHLATLLPQNAFLIQQGIPRAEHQMRPFDIRVVLHKEARGTFGVTSQFARLADHGQIVTNVTAGGGGIPLQELLTKQEQKALHQLAVACANRLAAALPAPLGELGLDLALDKQRNFWLIEANSKPRFKMDPEDPTTARIANRIVGYARFLLQPRAAEGKRVTPPSSPPSRKPARPAQTDR